MLNSSLPKGIGFACQNATWSHFSELRGLCQVAQVVSVATFSVPVVLNLFTFKRLHSHRRALAQVAFTSRGASAREWSLLVRTGALCCAIISYLMMYPFTIKDERSVPVVIGATAYFLCSVLTNLFVAIAVNSSRRLSKLFDESRENEIGKDTIRRGILYHVRSMAERSKGTRTSKQTASETSKKNANEFRMGPVVRSKLFVFTTSFGAVGYVHSIIYFLYTKNLRILLNVLTYSTLSNMIASGVDAVIAITNRMEVVARLNQELQRQFEKDLLIRGEVNQKNFEKRQKTLALALKQCVIDFLSGVFGMVMYGAMATVTMWNPYNSFLVFVTSISFFTAVHIAFSLVDYAKVRARLRKERKSRRVAPKL